jgi:4-amino-4-deoxy-L-arabinose transferase-like glycosyltransferase
MINILKDLIRTYWPELLLAVVAFVLMTLGLRQIEIDPFSEFFNLETAKETVLSKHYLPFQINHQAYWLKEPLWTWLTMLVFQGYGITLTGSRLLAVACSSVMLLLTGTLAVRLFNNKRAGLFTILTLMCTFGYNYWGCLSTPDAMVSLIYLGFFHLLLNVMGLSKKRHDDATQSKKLYGVAFGLLLGLLMLLKGTLSTTILLLLAMGLPLAKQTKEPFYAFFPAHAITVSFLLTLTPWLILGSVFSGNNGFAFSFLFQYPLDRFFGLGEWQALSHHGLFYASHMMWDALPLLAFIPAIFTDCFSVNKRDADHEQRLFKWLIGWFGIGFIVYSLSCYQEPTSLLAFYPPLAILTGQYFAKVSEVKLRNPVYGFQGTLLAVILILLLSAIALTIILFHIVPNTFAAEFWSFPGQAILEFIQIKDLTIPLPEAFPVWKLWLVPGPFILLLGCFTLSLIQSEKQFTLLPTLLLSTLILFGIFFRLIYIPVFSRPIAKTLASEISQRLEHSAQHTKEAVVLYGQSPNIKRIFFFLSPKATQVAKITQSEDHLRTLANRSNTYTFGVIPNQDYYRLLHQNSPQNLQLVNYQWSWGMEYVNELNKVFLMKSPQFSQMQSGVILFSKIPEFELQPY